MLDVAILLIALGGSIILVTFAAYGAEDRELNVPIGCAFYVGYIALGMGLFIGLFYVGYWLLT